MEQIDDLQYRGLKIIQDDTHFRYGTDAVLLAAFCDLRKGELAVDLGTGTGIIPLLTAKRTGARLVGLEIQPKAAALARRNAALNGMDIQIVEGDLKDAPSLLRGLRPTAVICNPPYDREGSGGVSRDMEIRIARHEGLCTLEDVARAAAGLLQTGGRFYMIHRAKRVAEAIYALKQNGLEPKRMRFIANRQDATPGYVLIKSVKDAAPEVVVEPPLILYGEDGQYTDEMNRIYHRGAYADE